MRIFGRVWETIGGDWTVEDGTIIPPGISGDYSIALDTERVLVDAEVSCRFKMGLGAGNLGVVLRA